MGARAGKGEGGGGRKGREKGWFGKQILSQTGAVLVAKIEFASVELVG